MLSLLLFTALFLLPGVLSAPAELIQVSKRQGSYYWSNWSEGNGNWNCRNEAGGKYSVTWSGKSGGFVCGKGWTRGGNRFVFFIPP
jgi:endo-1,4-beta-xylanase